MAAPEMFEVQKDIKSGKLRRAYLLFGEEQYLVRFFRDRLVKACMGKTIDELKGDMNFFCFSGKDVTVNDFSDAALTMPFFAERRMIVVEGAELFARANDELLTLLKNLPESTLLVFLEEKPDKRLTTFKELSRIGLVEEFVPQNDERLTGFIVHRAQDAKLNITQAAVRTILDDTGRDMFAIASEMEKLTAYCMDKGVIEKTDVDELCHVTVQDRVFDMIGFMANRQQKDALKLYYDLLELREPPLKILALIAKQFRILIAVKDLMNHGMSSEQIGQKMEFKGRDAKAVAYVARKYEAQAKQFSTEELKNALRDAAEYDRLFKSGGISDRMAVELLLIRYSGKED